METLYYHIGKENEEYWALLDELRKNGESVSGEWSGDYYKTTYRYNGFVYVVWENMDLGIQSEIDKIPILAD